MMRCSHSNLLYLAFMQLGERAHFLGVFVGHQEITFDIACHTKQMRMIYCRVSIQALPSALPQTRIRRINEKEGPLLFRELTNAL